MAELILGSCTTAAQMHTINQEYDELQSAISCLADSVVLHVGRARSTTVNVFNENSLRFWCCALTTADSTIFARWQNIKLLGELTPPICQTSENHPLICAQVLISTGNYSMLVGI